MGMWSDVSKQYSPQPCTNCGDVEVRGQWWGLSSYFEVTGYFCPKCYDLVAHDSYRQPTNPEQYKAIRVKQMLNKHY